MQRKNHILKNSRSGMAMIMAIAVIVVLGTIMAMSLQITAQTSKQTVNDYLHEQAILLTRSATEYTLLRISAQDRNVSGCLTALNGTYAPDGTTLFDMNVSIRYIGLSGEGALNECTPGQNYIQNTDVSDDNSKGSILLDIIVTADESLTTEPIRYHRRTLQKL
ncbi:MAG: type II secretion system protein [Campylobacterota bacterium]|nr:type II secretion system protein [Campylobacterota bacterium]